MGSTLTLLMLSRSWQPGAWGQQHSRDSALVSGAEGGRDTGATTGGQADGAAEQPALHREVQMSVTYKAIGVVLVCMEALHLRDLHATYCLCLRCVYC